jgi:hypothetical protein
MIMRALINRKLGQFKKECAYMCCCGVKMSGKFWEKVDYVLTRTRAKTNQSK